MTRTGRAAIEAKILVMIVPKGKIVHENLATSYVRVDGLVDDLCEGGFSGMVEIVLRNVDSHILIERGRVVGAIETVGDGGFFRTSVDEISDRARVERGRVSVFNYRPGTAEAIADRMEAQSLYTGLSTEFADLRKMVLKLSRERDRRWFIEVIKHERPAAMIHLEHDRCRVIRAEEPLDDAKQNQTAQNSDELQALLDECANGSCNFDVYFRPASEPFGDQPIKFTSEVEETLPASDTRESAEPARQIDTDELHEPAATSHLRMPLPELEERETQHAAGERGFSDRDQPETSYLAAYADIESPVPPLANNYAEEAQFQDEPSISSSFEDLSEDEVMAETKRLMGEIARTIEETTRSVEQRDIFPMYLRAGQLKIAERYPFLDPFGAEFEYLSGEIAFIGKAHPVEFIAGLTEALGLAITSVVQSSSQPARTRARLTDELRSLKELMRPELEQFGLDRAIEQIIHAYSPEAS